MLDLSFLYPFVIAAAVFLLVVIGIVAVLRATLGKRIAASQALAVVPATDDAPSMRTPEIA